MTLPTEKKPLTEGEQDKIRLRANYLNGIANSFAVAGTLTIPIAAATYSVQPAFAFPFAVLCFFVSIRLHLFAQRTLEGLDQ